MLADSTPQLSDGRRPGAGSAAAELGGGRAGVCRHQHRGICRHADRRRRRHAGRGRGTRAPGTARSAAAGRLGRSGVHLPPGVHVTPLPEYRFEQASRARPCSIISSVSTLDGFGLQDKPLADAGGGRDAGLSAGDAARRARAVDRRMRDLHHRRYMVLDAATRRNLELTETIREGGKARLAAGRAGSHGDADGWRACCATWIGQPAAGSRAA